MLCTVGYYTMIVPSSEVTKSVKAKKLEGVGKLSWGGGG
jgi:hypothetical protein